MVKIFFYKGNSTHSKLIRKITKSKYSHVGIIPFEGHKFDTDALNKVRISHLDYAWDMYDVVTVDLNIDEDFMYKSLKAKYDYLELLRYFIDIKSCVKKYTCVELVLMALNIDNETNIITPQELYEYLKCYEI